ncbi:MAG TPA: ketoacyl-synthetase C-terminal extension domain-containing protein, partial [Thermoanaerobaculia bacterium]
ATSGFHQIANRAGMLSPDGKCYSFDGRANGFAPGEAVGVVVLKRLRDAVRDGDHIHGVIAGTGINQDGKSNGLTAPNVRAQEQLERTVYDRFKIDPATIQVIEAHGTGTLFGDSIEHEAIARAFRASTDKKQFCALGSVKTNIGHAGNAAGIASVLKLLLSLRNRQIAPSLHFDRGNPAIDFASSPFYVNTGLNEWRVDGGQKRRGAVSSFGFSGTNAHLVIEEAPAIERAAVELPAHLIVLSARTAAQLKQQVRNLLALAKGTADVSLNDMSFSLFVGRMHQSHRLACVVRNQAELIRLLEQWLATGSASQLFAAEIAEGRVREQAALKKFGNYCIRECRETADAATYLENLSAIADLYIQGYSLDYPALFGRESRRMPLPTYPFADERYWVGETPATAPIEIETVVAEPLVEARWIFSREGGPHIQPMGAADKIELFLQQETALQLQKPMDSIPTNQSYFDLGLSSLAIAHLIRNLNELLGEELSPSSLFEFTDIQSLAGHLARTYLATIDALAVTPRDANATGQPFPLHPAKLPVAVAPEVPELSPEEILEQVLWQGASLDETYEKVTF